MVHTTARWRAGGRRAAAAGTIAAVVALAACGGGSDNGVASASGSGNSASGSSTSARGNRLTEKDALKFSKCMRDHGVTNFPDPTVDSNGNVRIFRRSDSSNNGSSQMAFDPQSPTFRSAISACRKLLPTFTLTPQQQAEFRDAALKFAKCMRKHGIDVPDPNFSQAQGQGGGGGMPSGRGGRLFGGAIDRNDPKARAALRACRSVFANLPGRGPGRGFAIRGGA